jgi:hypothetical protein
MKLITRFELFKLLLIILLINSSIIEINARICSHKGRNFISLHKNIKAGKFSKHRINLKKPPNDGSQNLDERILAKQRKRALILQQMKAQDIERQREQERFENGLHDNQTDELSIGYNPIKNGSRRPQVMNDQNINYGNQHRDATLENQYQRQDSEDPSERRKKLAEIRRTRFVGEQRNKRETQQEEENYPLRRGEKIERPKPKIQDEIITLKNNQICPITLFWNDGKCHKGKCLNEYYEAIFDVLINELQLDEVGFLGEILGSIKEYLVEKLSEKLDACFGNFLGETLTFDENKGAMEQCTNMPLKSDSVFGSFSLNINIKKIAVNVCIVFNRFTHTYAISISGDTLGTILQFVVPGIDKILEFIDYIGIGLSIKEQSFEKEINVLNPIIKTGKNKLSIVEFNIEKVKVPGNFYINIGFKIPDDYLKFGSFDMSEYISLTADGLIMMGLHKGDKNIMARHYLKSLNHAMKKSQRNINQIFEQGNSFDLLISGKSKFELDLSDISLGFIPKLEINIADFNVWWNYPHGLYISYEGKQIFEQVKLWMKSVFRKFKKLSGVSAPVSCEKRQEQQDAPSDYFYLTINQRGLFFKFNLLKHDVKFNLYFKSNKSLVFAITVNENVLYSGEINGKVLEVITVGMDLIDRGLVPGFNHPLITLYNQANFIYDNIPVFSKAFNEALERQSEVNRKGWEEFKCWFTGLFH